LKIRVNLVKRGKKEATELLLEQSDHLCTRMTRVWKFVQGGKSAEQRLPMGNKKKKCGKTLRINQKPFRDTEIRNEVEWGEGHTDGKKGWYFDPTK